MMFSNHPAENIAALEVGMVTLQFDGKRNLHLWPIGSTTHGK